MTNLKANMINTHVASHIAYLINKIDCAEIMMKSENCRFGSEKWNSQEATMALAVIRLAEYGIKLPLLETCTKDWELAGESSKFHAESVTRTLEEHIEVEA